jgi:hypothetical protein
MKLGSRKLISKAVLGVSWGLGFALILSAFSAPAFADRIPEMDPSLATGAMALLSSGLLLIAGRRRAK